MWAWFYGLKGFAYVTVFYLLTVNAAYGYQGGGAFAANVVPDKGSWFEGWYSKFTAFGNSTQVAVIVGSVLKEGKIFDKERGLPGYVAVIIQKPDEPIQVFEKFPESTFLKNEEQTWPISNPKPGHAPVFTWQDEFGSFMNEKEIQIKFDEPELNLRIRWRLGRKWSFRGPEQFLTTWQQLPLHWYVESLDAPANLELDFDGEHMYFAGTLHLEKNWGKSFPKKWIWIQGTDEKHRLRLGLAGGHSPIGSGLVGSRVWAFGLNSAKLNLRQNPSNMVFTSKIDPCNHSVQVTGWNKLRKIYLELKSDASDFKTVHTPSPTGFIPGAIESFKAYGKLEITNGILRSQKLQWDLKDFALEFGGEYRCPDWSW